MKAAVTIFPLLGRNDNKYFTELRPCAAIQVIHIDFIRMSTLHFPHSIYLHSVKQWKSEQNISTYLPHSCQYSPPSYHTKSNIVWYVEAVSNYLHSKVWEVWLTGDDLPLLWWICNYSMLLCVWCFRVCVCLHILALMFRLVTVVEAIFRWRVQRVSRWK